MQLQRKPSRAKPSPVRTDTPVATPDPQGRHASELFGVNDPPANTRQRLVETALDLFYTRGFHAVGLDNVLDIVGISKQAFYKHFESKDDLAAEALRVRDERETEEMMRQVRALVPSGDPREMLLAPFEVLDKWFTHPDYNGCMFLTACMEFPSPNDPLHQVAARHFSSCESGLIDLARAAGADEPAVLARELIMLMEGAIACRLTASDDKAAQNAGRLAALAIDSRIRR